MLDDGASLTVISQPESGVPWTRRGSGTSKMHTDTCINADRWANINIPVTLMQSHCSHIVLLSYKFMFPNKIFPSSINVHS